MSSRKKLFEGKVRTIYEAGKDRLLVVTTDRISAYDIVMPTPVPDKGKILNSLSEFWFSFTENTVKNHLLTCDVHKFPEPFKGDASFNGRSMLVKKLKMIPFECIVRGYVSGSAWESYKKDGTVCGEKVECGLSESDKLKTPVFTPSTKSEAGEGHDINVSFDYMKSKIGCELSEKIKNASLNVYSKCAGYAEKRGIIIADTKLEFGLDENGELVLADEVLTPDSSRFWSVSEYIPGKPQISYDKQYLRDWLSENGYRGVSPAPELPADIVKATREKYIEAYEIITGRNFE